MTIQLPPVSVVSASGDGTIHGLKILKKKKKSFEKQNLNLLCAGKYLYSIFPVVMYGCDSWTIKKAEHRKIDAFKLLCWRRPLDCKEIQPVHPKGDQSWVFIGRTDAEAETPILGPPHAKS